MTVTSTPVWHDIFRRVTLKPDNITLEAETYEDTLNIVRGPGVNFGAANVGSDTFEINVDYDISVPAATTKISLEDVNGNLSEITLTPGRGVAINRISAQELEFESFSVTETDTLHTVTERNNITSNKIFVNDLEVGTIASNSSEDGFTGYDAGHNLIGDGTLDNPMRFSPLYQDSIAANNTDQFEFIAVGPGTLAYAANYVFDTAATTGSVTLEREDPANPGNWTTLDTQSGNTVGVAYFIDGTYSELYSGSITYRLTFAWTGNTGTATWYTNNTFEGGAYTPIANPQIKTDTNAKTVDINDIQFFQNTIRTTASNADVVFDLSGTGQVRVLGNVTADNFYGDITGDVLGNLTGDVTGNVSGNAGTVTNGVYTTGSYANPTWITSLDGTKITNAVLTTGSYYDPSWITGLDASKIVGSIALSDITIDGTIRIFDNVIETTVSNADLELRGNGTGVVKISDELVTPNLNVTKASGFTVQSVNSGATTIQFFADDTFTYGGVLSNGSAIFGSTGANPVSLRQSGVDKLTVDAAGDVIVANKLTTTQLVANGASGAPAITTSTTNLSSAAWTFNGVNLRIPARMYTDTTTPAGNQFESYINVIEGGSVNSTNVITIDDLAALYVGTPSAVGNSTATRSWAIFAQGPIRSTNFVGSIGATTQNSGDFTTISASQQVTFNPANSNISMSPTGTGTVTINPATAGNINNMVIGATTRAAGNFTSLDANGNVTLGSDDTDSISINANFATGTQIKSAKSNGNTLNIAAYDVDGTTYTNLITLTASNTPTLSLVSIGAMTISSTSAGEINNMNIGATTAGTGKFTTLISTNTAFSYQPTPTSLSAANVLTASQLLTGILINTSGTGNWQMPTGAQLDAALPALLPNDTAFDFTVIVTVGAGPTITANTGVTLLGNMAVSTGTSATFRVRKTAASTYTVYRL